MGRFNGIATNWSKKSLIILVSIGALLLIGRPPANSHAQESHRECVGNACVWVSGPGPHQCNDSWDCGPPPGGPVTASGCAYHPCDPVGPIVGAHAYVIGRGYQRIAETTTGADGCFTITSPESGPLYILRIDPADLPISFWTYLPQESGDMGTLEVKGDCISPPGEGECVTEFPEADPCCPIKSVPNDDLGLLRRLINAVTEGLKGFLGNIISITITLRASDLDRSDDPPKDANYLWASHEEDGPDPRRIALPGEQPEAASPAMWPGAALRIAPPDYRRSNLWAYHRDVRNKWEIPLNQYGIDSPWWGDDGEAGDKSKAAHYALNESSRDLWYWLINTPGLEERIGSLRPLTPLGTDVPTYEELGSVLGTNNVVQPDSPPRPTSNSSVSFSPNLSIQLAQKAGHTTSVTGSCSVTGGTWTISPIVSVTPNDPNCVGGDVHVTVFYPDGSHWSHTCGNMNVCTNLEADSFSTTGAVGNTVTIRIEVSGGTCTDGGISPVDITLTEDGCEGWGTGPPLPPPPEAELCNLNSLAPFEYVCSQTGERSLSGPAAAEIILGKLLGEGLELIPFFTYLQPVTYRLTGALTDKYRDLREAGVGGVFDLFLPPDETPPEQQKFATLDAPANLETSLGISVQAGCLPGLTEVCDEVELCPTPETCETVRTNCRCCLGNWCYQNQFTLDIPLESEGELLHIWGLGSIRPALDHVQQWLGLPQ